MVDYEHAIAGEADVELEPGYAERSGRKKAFQRVLRKQPTSAPMSLNVQTPRHLSNRQVLRSRIASKCDVHHTTFD
jgi:hypothetical protein